eukprot:gnl/TRDRNA2_/TRDRNA2_84248_c0_seq1.p1 gnl/TRDRNA2_/TRDRNA2_84248_c0~~gnl/TRDRNA2_/TRDRNA2_84248_c0_seq1.p1  ORF type:complete len:303 (+),score=46.16 gnl/TRDRNA2_/TRDRNA2_84248_c0_seq1:81-911(+)
MSAATAVAPKEALSATFADRVAGALWGIHIADALAMPAHWYYGGQRQVFSDYGGPIKGYVKPKMNIQGSIMNLSNTGGAGRGGFDGDIVGTVIMHGKKKYWERGVSHHYHCTLEKGENTIETDLVRLCYKSITDNGGKLSTDMLRERYVSFMTTPGTHNDCYVSTCHRMFFHNRQRGTPLEKCPDNDGHNVDTQDGLSMAVPVALATATLSADAAHKAVGDCVYVTRNSRACVQYGSLLTDMLRQLLEGKPLAGVLEKASGSSLASSLNRADPVVA